MHKKQTQSILAVRPGRREMGVAVLQGTTLQYWGVAGFRNSKADQVHLDIHARLQTLIKQYQPKILAMEKVSSSRSKASPVIKKIAVQIAGLSLNSSLHFYPYSLETIKNHLCDNPQATRRDVVNQILKRYPHLKRYATWQSRWQEEYWSAMFVAIAVGLVYKEKNILL